MAARKSRRSGRAAAPKIPRSKKRGEASPQLARNLNERAYSAIKNEIIACLLMPGQEIAEGPLAKRFRFGKAPIRSALTRLRQEGFVISRGRRGSAVAPVTLRDIQEVFELRLILEIAATRLAAGKVDRTRLLQLNAAAHAAHHQRRRASGPPFEKANRALHRYIMQASGNRRLAELVIQLSEQHERIVHLGLALGHREGEFLHHHDDLVEALIGGEGARAAEIAERALRGGQDKIMQALLRSADPAGIIEISPPR
jgi:DNA-binding GntR family transcriptional regulator